MVCVFDIRKPACSSDVGEGAAILIGGSQFPVSAPFIWNKFVRGFGWLKDRDHNVTLKKFPLRNTSCWQKASRVQPVSKNKTSSHAE